jgi:hypothetical protein
MATSFSKRLKRELLGSPKKAAMLALLCVVALYFWAPLVADWFKGTDVVATAAPVTDTAPAALTPAVPGGSPAAVPTYQWRDIARCLDEVYRSGHEKLANTRDPFQPVQQLVATEPQETEVPIVLPAITPQAAGLALSSTMVGPRYSVALIGGEAYRVGDEVPGASDGEIVFRLKSVHVRHVVLERDGQEFELALKTPETLSNQLTSQQPASSPDTSSDDE